MPAVGLKVFADVVGKEIQVLPGVNGATALLWGTAAQPELRIDVKIDDRAVAQDVIRQIHQDVVPHRETVLETPLRNGVVLLNVSARCENDRAAVLVTKDGFLSETRRTTESMDRARERNNDMLCHRN